VRLARRSTLSGLVGSYQSAAMSYVEVGATQGTLPEGYRHLRRRTRLGTGQEVFERASAALCAWEMHRGSGLAVAVDGPASVGRTVVLGIGRPLALVMPCRVVCCIEEEARRGFAYGTLTGHPEQGEESFVVTSDTGGVWLEIAAFSRPGAVPITLVGGAGRAMQMRATRRYERALAFLAT
jgi:uncharacterized protein (UPF0548 family)